MRLAASNKVFARNGLGRFIAECEDAARETVEEAVERGAKLSKRMAPVGSKVDPRSIPIRESIYSQMTGRTSGRWVAAARHAMAQETGAVPHVIMGNPNLSFYWEAAGRRWIPASVFYGVPGLRDSVNHPGNAPQPFLRPAYEVVMRQVMQIARQKYPG